MIAFFKALTALIRAFVPLIVEKTRRARIERIKEGYFTRLEAVIEDPAAAFAAFDDNLRAEGIVTPDDSDRRIGDQKDRPESLSSLERLVD